MVRATGREGVKFRGRMDRMAWRTAPRASLAQWDDLVRFADAAKRDGLTRTVVCGMGGSSLAPAVLASSFANTSLSVLDSTDPSAVIAVARAAEFDRTLVVVCSKSGSTVETLAFYHYLAARADAARFVAITDPGSPLEALARERGFRAVFPHPPDVGGRCAARRDGARGAGQTGAPAAGGGGAAGRLDRAARGGEHRERRARRRPR